MLPCHVTHHISHIVSYVHHKSCLSLHIKNLRQVLFASSEWINAEAFCIGGNTADYAPHEHAWYDDDVPYLFVSYDFGRSKAFLDCGNGRPSAGDVVAAAVDDQRGHLEINRIAEIDAIRMPDAPIVAFLLGANPSAFWSIDAWGAARTDSDCQWRADPLQSPSLDSVCNVVQYPTFQPDCECNGNESCTKGCCQANNGLRTCKDLGSSACKAGVLDPTFCTKDAQSQNGPCDAEYPVCCTDGAGSPIYCCVKSVSDCPDNDDPPAPLVCPSR